jgi:hypothetical protein
VQGGSNLASDKWNLDDVFGLDGEFRVERLGLRGSNPNPGVVEEVSERRRHDTRPKRTKLGGRGRPTAR